MSSDLASEQEAVTPRRLRRGEASDYLRRRHGLQVAPATLAKFATVGGGPRFHKAGRFPLYPQAELDGWAERRLGELVENTTEADAQGRA